MVKTKLPGKPKRKHALASKKSTRTLSKRQFQERCRKYDVCGGTEEEVFRFVCTTDPATLPYKLENSRAMSLQILKSRPEWLGFCQEAHFRLLARNDLRWAIHFSVLDCSAAVDNLTNAVKTNAADLVELLKKLERLERQEFWHHKLTC